MEEYLIIKMNDVLIRLKDTILLLLDKEKTNEQEVLEWMDEINKLSVTF